MRKTLKNVGISLSCLALAGIMVLDAKTPIMAVEESDVNQAQNEADKVQNKIDELENQLNQIADNITDTQSYIVELDSTLEAYTSQLVDIRGQISNKQTEIDNKKTEINDTLASIEKKEQELAGIQADQVAQYDAMKLRIQYMYETGEQTFLDMIFSADDMSDMLGRAEYVDNIISYDREQLEKLAETQADIEATLAGLNSEKEALETQKTELEGQQNEMYSLEGDLQNQQTYVDTILTEKENTLSSLQSQQADTEASKAAAEKELQEKQALANQIKAAWEEEQRKAAEAGQDANEEAQKTLEQIGLAGGFTWPIPGFNLITSEWGNRLHPVLGYYTLHDGMDISGAGIYGMPIVAAYSGTVSIADSSNAATGYGYYVKLDHGVGVSTLYAHMSLVAVSAGQHVEAGQVIGYIGSTGNSTGAHLHFSVFIQGVSCNPRDYIAIP